MTEGLARGWSEQDSRTFLKPQLARAGVQMGVDPERIQQAIREGAAVAPVRGQRAAAASQ